MILTRATPPVAQLRSSLEEHAPGVSVAVVVSLAVYAVSSRYEAPVMLFALLLGISISFLGEQPRLAKGIRLMASTA